MTGFVLKFMPRRGQRQPSEFTLLVGILSAFFTLGVWQHSKVAALDRAHAVFDLRADELARALAARADDYKQVLRGARGLFDAGRDVGTKEWRSYVQALDIGGLNMGIETMAVLRVVDAAAVGQFVAERRRDPETPAFALHLLSPRDQYVVISLIEPDRMRRMLAVGFDFGAEPKRAAALSLARDTGSPAATAPLRLLSEPTGGEANFSIYMPIYRPGMPTQSVEERRRAVWAYVGCAVRVERMVQGVVAGLEQSMEANVLREIAFGIQDVTDPQAPRDLYPPSAPRPDNGFVKRITIDVLGRQWSVEAFALPEPLSSASGNYPLVVACVVALFGVLCTGLTYTLGVLQQSRADLRLANVQLAKSEADLHRLAHSNSLTNLPNRRQFFRFGTAEWSRARRHHRPFAVLMIDVDHFKKINDLHGHAVGDDALRAMADICKETLRDGDLIARMGGEEFAAILTETDLANARVVAERLRQAVAELTVATPEGISLSCTVSVGVATPTDADDTLNDVVARADRALYAAKAAGRNLVMSQDSPVQVELAFDDGALPGGGR